MATLVAAITGVGQDQARQAAEELVAAGEAELAAGALTRAFWNPRKHPRVPSGKGGGEFAKVGFGGPIVPQFDTARPSRAEREAEAAKAFPVGTRVSTEIVTGGGTHTATGTVVGHKRGQVHIKTDTGDGTVSADLGKVKPAGPLDPFYNEIPETKGQVRVHAPVPSSGRGRQDDAAIAAWRKGHPVAPPITKAEARDEARAVSADEFQSLAREGLNKIGVLNAQRQPIRGLDDNWDKIKSGAWGEVQKSWGGATYDAKTGAPLPQGANRYALTVKPRDMETASVPESATEAEFMAAMDRAREQFRGELEKGQRYLGVFHDDETGRIDIDPVLVVDSMHDVETIGSYSHAIGGAYNFADGNGYWPPYVDPNL